jgi:hypothetical protein
VGGAREAPHPPTHRQGLPPGLLPLVLAKVFLQASCPWCSRSRLFLEHIAMGYFPISEFIVVPPCEPPVGFCLNIAAESGLFVLHHINDIKISHPELYNDSQFVVHGLMSEVERVMAKANCVIVNTFLEMEPEYVAGYAEVRKMKVWSVGPVSLHHWRMGTATLLPSRGGVTPPPSTPSQLGRRRGSRDLDLGQAGGGAQAVSRLDRSQPQQAGGGE